MVSTQLASAEVRRNIEYGRAGDQSLQMDAYTPQGDVPRPAAIVVHGGGWVMGNRETNVAPLLRPLQEHGYAWFSISYRFANDVFQFGAAVDDVQQAIQHVRQHAGEYNIDPTRIVLIGESAGAHLAVLAVMREPRSVSAVVAFYCPSDLESLAQQSRSIPEAVRQAVLASGLGDVILDRLRHLSPLQHVRPDLPPFLLIHGTADTLVPYDQSQRLQAKLRESGVPCELIPIKGGGHGLRWWEHSPNFVSYRKQMFDWMEKRVLRSSTSKAS